MPRTKPPKQSTKPPRKTPGRYNPDEYPRVAREACAHCGARDTDLARMFNVTSDAVQRWKREHKEFGDAVREGRDWHTVNRVELSLAQRANGYKYMEVKREDVEIDTKGEDGEKVKLPGTKVTRTLKQVAPDITAIMFLLQNRAPERWKNVRHVEAGGTVRVKHSREELADISADMDDATAQRKYLELLRSTRDNGSNGSRMHRRN